MLERERGISLILTDVMMPEMTGPELVREAARLHPDTAILFVTGYAGEAGEAEDLQGYEVLRKPFTVAALAEAVAGALSRRPEAPPARKAARRRTARGRFRIRHCEERSDEAIQLRRL